MGWWLCLGLEPGPSGPTSYHSNHEASLFSENPYLSIWSQLTSVLQLGLVPLLCNSWAPALPPRSCQQYCTPDHGPWWVCLGLPWALHSPPCLARHRRSVTISVTKGIMTVEPQVLIWRSSFVQDRSENGVRSNHSHVRIKELGCEGGKDCRRKESDTVWSSSRVWGMRIPGLLAR